MNGNNNVHAVRVGIDTAQLFLYLMDRRNVQDPQAFGHAARRRLVYDLHWRSGSALNHRGRGKVVGLDVDLVGGHGHAVGVGKSSRERRGGEECR
jgi:hypothetical protein